MKNLFKEEVLDVKPFLKWAGGKTQLSNELNNRLPKNIKENMIIDLYVEPFFGWRSNVLFFKVITRLSNHFYLISYRELIIGFKAIQNDHRKLMNKLVKNG